MKKTCSVIFAIVSMLALCPARFAQTRVGQVNRKARVAAAARQTQRSAAAQRQPARRPPPSIIPITVNDDGTFSPDHVLIRPGTTVRWSHLGRTDAIVQIADPSSAPGSDVCGIGDNHLAHRFQPGGDEFTGPMRNGVSGIFALGPDGPGYVQVPETTKCDCERSHNCQPDPTIA